MVQAVLKSRMSDEDRKQRAEQVVRGVNAAFPSTDFENWNRCERLVPSAQTCAALLNEYQFSFREAAQLFNRAGYYLEDRARYAEAEPLYRQSLALREQLYGPDSDEVATQLSNLGILLRNTNRMAEAEPLMRRALEIDEKSYGRPSEVAIDLNNLARCCRPRTGWRRRSR